VRSPSGVDVVIVTHESALTVASAIDSIRSSPDVRRVIVVDNLSCDRSAEESERAGADVVVRNQRNAGFASGVNLGLAHAHAAYVLLLNPDAAMTAAALRQLVDALEADPSAVLAGPLLEGDDGTQHLGARRFSTVANRVIPFVPLVRKAFRGAEYKPERLLSCGSHPVPVDYLWGAAMLARRGFLEEVGGLDERYFMYSEDEDIARQAAERKLRAVLVPDATARHIGAVSSQGRRDVIIPRQVASNELLFRKWEGERSARIYRVALRWAMRLQVVSAAVTGRREEMHIARSVLRSLRAVG
jgi:N-acetylglucosaminyl-diphospho-decaprenol L-rhamnosyltransferase